MDVNKSSVYYRLKIFWKKCIGDTVYKKFFRVYFLIIIIGSVLLFLPISLNNGWSFQKGYYKTTDNKYYTFADAIFTASSAFSDTGLVTNNTNEVFSFFGQIVLLFLIQFGGLGFLAVIILLWNFLTSKKKYSFEQRVSLYMERGNNNKNSAHKIIIVGFVWVLVSELIGWFLLTLFFYFATPGTFSPVAAAVASQASSWDAVQAAPAESVVGPVVVQAVQPSITCNDFKNFKGNFGLSCWAGLFHVVSAVNNAGFDIIGSHSIQPYRNDENNILSVILFLQFLIGGIGYPVLYDVYLYVKAKRNKREHNFSLFSKIALVSYLVIGVIGAGVGLLFELAGKGSADFLKTTNGGYGWGANQMANKVWNLIFITFSSRSAGFSSLDISSLSTQTKLLLNYLMFIGASPASTGGGIRTVAFFLIMLRLFFFSIGRKHVSIFKKSILDEQIYEAFLIYIMATFIIISVVVLIVIGTPTFKDKNIIDIMFEAFSAFGTTGLSTGVTQDANIVSRFGLILLMFVGQLGVSNTLLSCTRQNPKNQNLSYGYESVKLS